MRKGFCFFYSRYWTLAYSWTQHYFIYPLKTFLCALLFIFSIILYSPSLTLFFHSPFSPDLPSFRFYFLLFLSIIYPAVMDSGGQGCDAVNSGVTQILILPVYSAVLQGTAPQKHQMHTLDEAHSDLPKRHFCTCRSLPYFTLL